MLLFEIFTDDVKNQVLALITTIDRRYKNKQATPKIKTRSFLKLANNVGITLDYESFVDLVEKNPVLKNKIVNFNKDTISFGSKEDSDSTTHANDQQDIVSKMAQQSVKI
jgi:hypothetical protein